MVGQSPFLVEPDDSAEPIALLGVGDEIRVLDLSRGWAWGYGPDGQVGYIEAVAVGI